MRVVISALCIITASLSYAADPLEPFNRKIHQFNDFFDRILLKPAAVGYQQVTPKVVDDGITNVFENLGEPRNAVNNLLQAKPSASGVSIGRFAINSTIGLAGFFDPANQIGWREKPEDFGQTLAVWGVGSGPYIVLPLFGPSTLRDGLAGIPDSALSPLPYAYGALDAAWYVPLAVTGVDAIDSRADVLTLEALLTGDRYVAMRDFYLENRAFEIADGKVEDEFASDLESFSDFEDFEELGF
ncbi:MlaA family lipoprotein [Salinibius halmophilus]|uniref:MlaA family lipoprotein n=1 Tax=Salinibius halmophilus TaxID=1853216 RepID=UPI000E662822|nr:VacJ family lipoprotein [Salinibius halmophilus]